ncbi:MAG: hypothetical protein QXJ07_05535 [Candidatus Bathyarchaeia archaeon]
MESKILFSSEEIFEKYVTCNCAEENNSYRNGYRPILIKREEIEPCYNSNNDYENELRYFS